MNELLARFRQQYPEYDDLSDDELARALHQKFYADMDWQEFSARVGADVAPTGPPSNTGPTPPLPFNNLSPMVGGALDFATALGTGMGLGLPLLSGDTRRNLAEMRARAPGATNAAVAAGAVVPGAIAGAGLGGAAAARAAANPYGFAIRHGPTVAARAGRIARGTPNVLLNLLKSRVAQGGGLIGAWELAQRLGR